jgi:putative membrane protein
MMSDGFMTWGGGFMWLFWIVLIVVFVMLIKSITGGSSSTDASHHETPLDILKKRYAKGEIDEEEFERRRKELES